MATEDLREGVTAFFAGEKPEFKGDRRSAVVRVAPRLPIETTERTAMKKLHCSLSRSRWPRSAWPPAAATTTTRPRRPPRTTTSETDTAAGGGGAGASTAAADGSFAYDQTALTPRPAR